MQGRGGVQVYEFEQGVQVYKLEQAQGVPMR